MSDDSENEAMATIAKWIFGAGAIVWSVAGVCQYLETRAAMENGYVQVVDPETKFVRWQPRDFVESPGK